VDQIVHHHTIPLWNPYEYGGAPFVGNPLSAIFYPPNIIFFLTDVGQAFKYLFFVNVFLLGAFTYLYGRLVIKSRPSSLLSSIVMMFNGVVVARINAGHVSNVDVLVWFPLLLYFIELCIRKKRLVFVAFLGIVVGLTILAGHIQVAFYSLIAGLLYFIIRIILEYLENRSIEKLVVVSLYVIAGYSIGFCLSSIQLLPVLEFGQYSARNVVSYEFATNFSIPILQSIEIFLPRIFGQPQLNFAWGRGSFTEFASYSGILAYVLALFSFFNQRNKMIVTYGILLVFSFLFVLGNYGPIFHLFYYFVPGFNHFRIPATMLFLLSFSISMLAGFGLSGFCESTLKKKFKAKYLKVITLILTSLSCLLSGYVLLDKNIIGVFVKEVISKKFEIKDIAIFSQLLITDLLVISFCLMIFTLLVFIKKIRKHSRVVIFVVCIVDLFFFGLPLLTTNNSYIDHDEERVIQKIDTKNFRVLDLANINPLILQKEHGEQVRSYSPALLSSFRDYLWSVGAHADLPYEPYVSLDVVTNYNLLKLLNVGYIISSKEIHNSNVVKIGQEKKLFLYKIYDSYPKAFTVVHVEKVSENDVLERIKSDTFQPRKTLLLNSKYPSFEDNEYQSRNIVMQYKTPNEISLSTNSPQDEYLFISEIWYPGWRAYVNGSEREVVKADSVFRSIHLSKGHNSIVFVYDPFSYKIGKYLSLLGIAVCILIFFGPKRKLLEINVRV
jgi:hypothetical protein